VITSTLNRSTCHSSIQTIRRRLEAIDWSFRIRRKGDDLESIHPYPAKFIGSIPRAFLTVLPLPPGTVVLDPFCGSGTTLIESQRLGISSVGIDLNPIACLISRVKTAPTPSGFQRAAIEVATSARIIRDPERWAIPNVDHWFKPEIQDAIAALIGVIRGYAGEESENALRSALSSILVRVSNQESDTRYAAIQKNISRSDVFELFLMACGKVIRTLTARDWKLVATRVIEEDTLALDPRLIGTPVGLVITSPPYPNAYEYWLYHKYRMWWLGFDPLAVKAREIGARAHFFKRDNHTTQNFWDQMHKVFNLIDSVLVKSGFVCFVIGRSKIHGQLVDNAEVLEKTANAHGMNVVFRIERPIASSRKSFNLAHANIKTETVLVFQKI